MEIQCKKERVRLLLLAIAAFGSSIAVLSGTLTMMEPPAVAAGAFA